MINGVMKWYGNIMSDSHMTSMHDYICVCESITMIPLPKRHGGQNIGFYHNFDVVDWSGMGILCQTVT
jgi:hypothetical protein